VTTPKYEPSRVPSVTPAGATNRLPKPKVDFPKDPIPQMPPAPPDQDVIQIISNTELPGLNRQMRRESERQFFERIAQDMRKQSPTSRAIFPEEPPISTEPFRPRVSPYTLKTIEPCYVVHRRLYFEQPNFERTGYDYGLLQPAICMGVFYYDTLLLPYHFCSDLQHRLESSVGKCLPGDPAPFVWPCERLSVSGLVGQGATGIGLGVLFP
jgi:hypothetical protein